MKLKKKKLIFLTLAVIFVYHYSSVVSKGGEDKYEDSHSCHNNNISSPRIVYPGSINSQCIRDCKQKSKKQSFKCENCTNPKYCTIQWTGRERSIVECGKEDLCQHYQLGFVSKSEDEILWQDFKSHSSLRMYISSFIDISSSNYTSKFIFIRCTEDEKDRVQVLALPPDRLHNKQQSLFSGGISVNFIILDDVSRADLYSLYPETITMLSKVNKDPLVNTEILDFQAVQSLGNEGSTNLDALFGGYINLYEDGEHEIGSHRFIFHAFKKAGHRTTVVESTSELENDIFQDYLQFSFEQQNLKERMKSIGLDDFRSFNSALIPNCCLQQRLVEAMVRSYVMDIANYELYRMRYFSSILIHSSSFNSQDLDRELKKLVSKSLESKNAITFITSAKSGSLDSSLPLMAIVPFKAKEHFPDLTWHSLVINQDRLISTLDVNEFLRVAVLNSPSEPSNSPGLQAFRDIFLADNQHLASNILTSRSCNDLPRLEYGCLCQSDLEPTHISRKIKLLGEFGCEHVQTGSLCGCSSIPVVAASKHQDQGNSFSHLKHVATIEMDTNTGHRSIITYIINTIANIIQIKSEGNNLNCDGETSKNDDILDHIDKTINDPAIKKKVEEIYQEAGVACCFLVIHEGPGVSTCRIVNACQSQILVKLDFQTETAVALRKGEYKVDVGPGRMEPVNVFISNAEEDSQVPEWSYTILYLESL